MCFLITTKIDGCNLRNRIYSIYYNCLSFIHAISSNACGLISFVVYDIQCIQNDDKFIPVLIFPSNSVGDIRPQRKQTKFSRMKMVEWFLRKVSGKHIFFVFVSFLSSSRLIFNFDPLLVNILYLNNGSDRYFLGRYHTNLLHWTKYTISNGLGKWWGWYSNCFRSAFRSSVFFPFSSSTSARLPQLSKEFI